MAEADDYDEFQAAIDNELKCPLCLSRFRTPKDLECPHVYCKECLENLLRSTGGGSTIDCPECRHITIIKPSKGIDGLKTNLRLRNMVEAAERQEKVQQKKDTLTRLKVPECGNHIGEKLHLYCETDDYLVCHVCAVVDHPHPDHKCRNVKEVVEEQKDRDVGNLCKASLKLDDLKQESREISDVESALEQFMEAEEVEIHRCVRNIQKAAKQQGAALINMMRQMHQEHINDLKEAREEVDDMYNRLEIVCEAIRENMNNATDYEYVASHQALHSNMMKQIQLKIPESVEKNFPRIKFVPNKGADSKISLGSLQTSKVKDVTAELCGQLTFGRTSNLSKADKIEDIAALPDGSLALVFKSRVGVYMTEGKYENVEDEEYKLQLSLEPPSGYTDKPCWVDTSSPAKTWLTRGVAVLDGKYAIIDGTPYVKIFAASGKFESMFSTMTLSLSKLYKQLSGESENEVSSAYDLPDVSYNCITQDVDNKTLYVGDHARKVITNHDSSGKCLSTFRLKEAPYKINIFGQRIAVTTVADRVDLLDKMTGEKIISIDVPLATGACVDIKSGCMFVTTTDVDSYEYENGTLEAYCSMTGKHLRCLMPVLYEPCGAMTLTSDERLAVVDKEGVNLYHFKCTYQ